MLKSILASCILCVPVWSAPPVRKPITLVMEGESVALGMTKSQIATKFKNYKITSMGEGAQVPASDSWMVMTKEAPFRAISNIAFKNEKAYCIYKYYDNVNDENPTSIANTLSEILTNWTAEYGNNFTVHTNTKVQADLIQRMVILSYLNRHLYIASTEGIIPPVTKKISHTTLYEILGD